MKQKEPTLAEAMVLMQQPCLQPGVIQFHLPGFYDLLNTIPELGALLVIAAGATAFNLLGGSALKTRLGVWPVSGPARAG